MECHHGNIRFDTFNGSVGASQCGRAGSAGSWTSCAPVSPPRDRHANRSPSCRRMHVVSIVREHRLSVSTVAIHALVVGKVVQISLAAGPRSTVPRSLRLTVMIATVAHATAVWLVDGLYMRGSAQNCEARGLKSPRAHRCVAAAHSSAPPQLGRRVSLAGVAIVGRGPRGHPRAKSRTRLRSILGVQSSDAPVDHDEAIRAVLLVIAIAACLADMRPSGVGPLCVT
jgi:hypothetical protein